MTPPPLLGTFEQLVLSAVLQVGSEAYPPLVLGWIEESTGRTVNRGSLYVSLDRLEAKGLLRSRPDTGDPDRGGRPKRYLEVTPEGVGALRHARDSLLASWAGIEPLLEDETQEG
jgi:PadR family transcriptional regulator PadR